MASNTLLHFLLPMVLVIGAIVGANANNSDETQLDESLQESLREQVSGANFCPPHEEFIACNSLCEFDCKTRNETSPQCDRLCVSSCRCVRGYVRGPKGICIKPDKCPDDDDTRYPVKRVCPSNEEWKVRANCQTNCTHPHHRLCIRVPVKGCICKKGFKRRPDGKCVPEYRCPKNDGISSAELLQRTCPPREHHEMCRANCQRNCSNINDNPGICPGTCIPGCVCNIGFIRGPNGLCIKPKECPGEVKCPPGEHFDSCLFNCQRNCSNWNQTFIPCNAMCQPGCVCDAGTVRSELPSGKCIRPEECEKPNEDGIPLPLLCKRNEEWSLCPSSCPDNCTNYQDKGWKCFTLCIPGCVCKSGFVKGPKGNCIKPDKCPKEKKPEDCSKLEYYDTCGTSCEDNCDNYQNPHRKCDKRCNVGCFCSPGYVRGPKGDCIWPFDCKKKSPSEDYQPSDRDLDEEHNEVQVESRDAEGIRIPILCKRNEVWSLCSSTCPDNCTNYQDKGRQCITLCIPGCVCKSGFVKGPKGDCIKPNLCPKEKRPEDCSNQEYYDTCGTACEDDCKNYNLPNKTCDKRCKIGCFCKPGYVRGPKGECIWPFICPDSKAEDRLSDRLDEPTESEMLIRDEGASFCPPHEEFLACQGLCELDCRTRNRTLPECNGFCVSSCRCESGYVRGPKGTCIKPDECPEDDPTQYPVARECPANEIWSGFAHCQTNCTHPKPFLCPRIVVKGCICKKEFKRRSDGKCVPVDKCPPNKGDVTSAGANFCPPHEEFLACQGLSEWDCGNRNTTLPEWKGFCVSSCRCESGYVRGPKGTCIKPDECPENDPTQYPVARECPDNEIWGGSAHCQTNCTHTKPIICLAIVINGCICKKEFKRRSDGKCVPVDKCPSNKRNIAPVDSEELANDPYIANGCPNALSCVTYCRSRGNRGGYCYGPLQQFCHCSK